jgi:hypothetical protein
MEAGRSGATDLDQLEFATDRGRALYSFNVSDFARIHRSFLGMGRSHSGIIAIPEQRYSIGEKMRRVAALVPSTTAEALRNTIAFL